MTVAKQFDVVKMWVQIYNLFVEHRIPRFERQMSLNGRIAFLGRLKMLKTKYNVTTSEELAVVFMFGYVHNPLNFGNIAMYGTIGSLSRVFPSYMKWKQSQIRLIQEKGLYQAMMETVPGRVTEVDQELGGMLDQLMKAYKQ